MAVISLIIPVYNVERYLARCLDSVLNQTYTDWEAICVNDGSPDGSRAILAAYQAKDARIKIVDKENGGLSDARNKGLEQAQGEYVIFLDSDDFIHPQTLEFSLALAKANGSNIVTWYKDPYYRLTTILRRKLGFDVDKKLPKSYYKRYQLEKVNQLTTSDVFAHFTEQSHSDIKMPLKHFYVWRFLIRRELLADFRFIKGITFEDFPWTSELMLRNKGRVTITSLPFYYYYPNEGSIDLSTKRARKINDWITGLEHAYKLYEAEAEESQRVRWQRQCMWVVIRGRIERHLKEIREEDLCGSLARRLQSVVELGCLDHPFDARSKACKERILSFVEQHLPPSQ